ncbi:S-layer homology domain-containing protein [Paenibacillus sp. Dod16]|uniref:S-layer homology domain-containing protein n=1 Tax=Paenibacillus sp. Dod16 TaxID=3416392 RepID=UPI003CF6E82E
MKTYSNKLAAMMVAAALGTASLPLHVLQVEAAGAPLAVQDIEQATQVLSQLRVMQGYQDGSMGITSPITRAELAKMLVLAFGLEGKGETEPSFTDVNPNAWYERYASELVAQDIMQAPDGRFDPRGTVTHAELVQLVSKALKRDAKSVDYWAKRFYSEDGQTTRGQAAYLISIAHEAIPSEKAKITSVRALNAITLIVTFDAPLTTDNEAFAKAKEDFEFNNGLELTNMPRLKTGSISTYIVPTSVQKPGTSYTLTYKGKTAGTFTGNSTKLDMTEVRQVAQDTFELEALKANGVVDYGYVISAYSGGRGANAFVLDENNSADGKVYQIISSGQGREVTITPAGGQPIVAKYVPFTQSTDGKQTSDWAQIANPTFVAEGFEPLDIIGEEAISDSSVSITLSEDPGDELFSGRSIELIDTEGGKLMATYKYSSRKGAVGVFDLNQEGKLKPGTTYTIKPVGKWAGETTAVLTVN